MGSNSHSENNFFFLNFLPTFYTPKMGQKIDDDVSFFKFLFVTLKTSKNNILFFCFGKTGRAMHTWQRAFCWSFIETSTEEKLGGKRGAIPKKQSSIFICVGHRRNVEQKWKKISHLFWETIITTESDENRKELINFWKPLFAFSFLCHLHLCDRRFWPRQKQQPPAIATTSAWFHLLFFLLS